MRSLPFSVILALSLGAGACQAPQLIPTPNIYLQTEENPFADVPEAFQSNQVDVLYVTDRYREEEEDGKVQYGYRRSPSMAYGSAVVQFGEDHVTFEQLVEASRSAERELDLHLSLKEVVEKGRFPATPLPYDPNDDATDQVIRHDPVVVAENERVTEAFLDDIRARLALTPTKEVYVYVHGYNNDFEYAVSVISQIWHFLPRRGVPIAYTWPAGKGGLRGYFYDRESGEFTIYHLKDFLRMLMRCDEIEKVHLIAHSRGTDVLLTALRELLIELGGEDFIPGENRKLGNVIVAAPDLDLEVVSQRISSEEIAAKIDRLTVYMSKTDTAIGLSTWLFVSQKRVGRISSADFDRQSRARSRSRHQDGVALIDANVDSGFIGHSYFYSHPSVLSDVILILRDDRGPGAEHGRPLIPAGDAGLWRLDNDYLEPEPEG